VKQYTIYGYDLSYFTRKVEAAFELSGQPFIRRGKTLLRKKKIERAGKTHQVPVVRCPDGTYLADSTPIIEYLDRQGSGHSLFPDGAEGVLVRLLEEWLDEWFSRVVIHFRWNIPECAAFAGPYLGAEILPGMPGFVQRKVGSQIAAWGQRAVRALALDQPSQQERVETVFERVCAALNDQLKETPYALGHRATAVDAVLIGALRAHLMVDPEPRRRLSIYPELLQWARRKQPVAHDGSIADFRRPNSFAQTILTEIGGDYQRYIIANRTALNHGQKAFQLDFDGDKASFLTRLYPEKSRMALVEWVETLEPADQIETKSWLAEQPFNSIFTQHA
jgi:glutathione S-transferase